MLPDLLSGWVDTEVPEIRIAGLPGGSAERIVRAISPHLAEVTVTVQNGDAECTLTTLIATESGR